MRLVLVTAALMPRGAALCEACSRFDLLPRPRVAAMLVPAQLLLAGRGIRLDLADCCPSASSREPADVVCSWRTGLPFTLGTAPQAWAVAAGGKLSCFADPDGRLTLERPCSAGRACPPLVGNKAEVFPCSWLVSSAPVRSPLLPVTEPAAVLTPDVVRRTFGC